jgi:outer membrane receptor protein involved in Fe transport
LNWSGTYVEGEGDSGAELADVPAPRLSVAGRYLGARWQAALRFEHRLAKDDHAPTEQPTPAADLLSASFGYRFERDFTIRLFGTNLLDETYLPSADELTVAAPGRSLGLGVRWAPR